MKISKILIILAIIAAPLTVANAQNPFAEPKNLQVLPDTIKGDQLRQVMRRFAAAIGKQCSYCHARAADGQGLDFQSDANDKKRVTREMMKMMGQVRQTTANLYPDDPNHVQTTVVCTTCHRGQANPFLIEEIMNNEIAGGGTAAAQAKYLELKKQYYGSHTYDFTGFTLAEYANRLILAGDLDNALEMAKFSRDQFPNHAYAHSIVGDVYMRQENYADAIEAYEGSLAVDPDQNGVIRQIESAKEAMED